MIKLQTIRRVTVYADAALASDLIEKFTELGSKGYTLVECRGRGKHKVVEDPLSSHATNVRIELLVQPPVAEKIMAYLHSSPYRRHSLAGCVETVEVEAGEDF